MANGEIVAIGDELTSGQRLDTNSQWLSQQLGDLGIRIGFHTTVGDELADCTAAFQIAMQRAEVIMVTGGLGPTADDLTRQALADAIGRPLLLDAEVLHQIEQLFRRRGRSMPPQNRVQAMFPEGSRVIANPHGTAPGIHVQSKTAGGKTSDLFALPGVPAEMREMWFATVMPQLVERLGDRRRMIRHRCIKCFGVGESDLEAMLPDLIRRGRSPTVGITVSRATITLRISAIGESEEHCHTLITPVEATIRECLGDLIFGEDHDELQQAVVRQLSARNQTVATAEWGSGGLLGLWLREADDLGNCYRGGQIRPPAISDQPRDGWSERVQEAAEEVRSVWQADYGLAVGPFPATCVPEHDALVRIAVAGPEGIQIHSVRFAGHPDILKARCAKQALDFLRKR